MKPDLKIYTRDEVNRIFDAINTRCETDGDVDSAIFEELATRFPLSTVLKDASMSKMRALSGLLGIDMIVRTDGQLKVLTDGIVTTTQQNVILLDATGVQTIIGWQAEEFLCLHLYYLFDFKITLGKEQRSLPNLVNGNWRYEEIDKLIEDEIQIVINALQILNYYQGIFSSQQATVTTLPPSDRTSTFPSATESPEELCKEFLKSLFTQIIDHRSNSINDIVIPCGSREHCLYVNLIRYPNHVEVSIDNLGLGAEHHPADINELGQAVPLTKLGPFYAGNIPLQKLILESTVDFFFRLLEFTQDKRDDEEVIEGFYNLLEKSDLEKIDPLSLLDIPKLPKQTVSNCVVNNYFAGFYSRINCSEYVEKYKPSKILVWFRKQELIWVLTKGRLSQSVPSRTEERLKAALGKEKSTMKLPCVVSTKPRRRLPKINKLPKTAAEALLPIQKKKFSLKKNTSSELSADIVSRLANQKRLQLNSLPYKKVGLLRSSRVNQALKLLRRPVRTHRVTLPHKLNLKLSPRISLTSEIDVDGSETASLFGRINISTINLEENCIHYQSRPAALKNIRDIISSQTATIRQLAITGIAGSGKSELVKEFALSYRENWQSWKLFPYQDTSHMCPIIIWLNATNSTTLFSSWLQVAEFLKIKKCQTEETTNDYRLRIIKEVKTELQKYAGWVMIFDNIVDAREIADFYPKQTSHAGVVILTARQRYILENDQCEFSLDSGMDIEQATTLFYTIYTEFFPSGFVYSTPMVEKFVLALGKLPLAINLCARHLAEINQEQLKNNQPVLEMEDYIANFIIKTRQSHLAICPQDKEPPRLKEFLDERLLDNYVLQAIRRLDKAYRYLLVVCACIDYTFLSIDCLKQLFSIEDSQGVRLFNTSAKTIDDDFTTLLNAVTNYPLIAAKKNNKGEPGYGMHELVARQTRVWFEQEQLTLTTAAMEAEYVKLLTPVVVLISERLIRASSLLDHSQIRAWLPHGLVLHRLFQESIKTGLLSPEFCMLQLAIGRAYFNLAQPKWSLGYYNSLRKSLELLYGADVKNLEIANLMLDTAIAYGDIGEAEKQLSLGQEALQIYQNSSENIPMQVKALMTIASAKGRLRNFEAKLEILLEALALFNTHLSDNPNTEILLNRIQLLKQLSNAYYQVTDYVNSQNYHNQALQVMRTVPGYTSKPEYGKYLETGANIAAEKGDFDRAIALYEETSTLLEGFDDTHHQIGDLLLNFGATLLDARRVEEAISKLEKALKVYEAFYSDKPHINVVNTLTLLAECYLFKGSVDESKSYAERALTLASSSFKDDAQYFLTLAYYILININQLDDNKLELQSMEVLEGYKKNQQQLHVAEFARAARGLGQKLYELGKKDLATDFMQIALNIYKENFGNEHKETTDTSVLLKSIASQNASPVQLGSDRFSVFSTQNTGGSDHNDEFCRGHVLKA